MKTSLTMRVLPDRLAICRLPPDAPFPDWAVRAPFWSVTRTPEEVSIVCPETLVPPAIRAERGWLALRVDGPLPLTMTGVLSSLAEPLADARITMFAISTFDTDIILVRETDLAGAREAFCQAGHVIS